MNHEFSICSNNYAFACEYETNFNVIERCLACFQLNLQVKTSWIAIMQGIVSRRDQCKHCHIATFVASSCCC